MGSNTSTTRAILTDAGATQAIEGAVVQAQRMGAQVTIVVVDEGGNLKAMRQMDGAPLVSIETARNKAFAAAAIGMPVDDFFEAIRADAAAVASFAARPGLALIAGGVPVVARRHGDRRDRGRRCDDRRGGPEDRRVGGTAGGVVSAGSNGRGQWTTVV